MQTGRVAVVVRAAVFVLAWTTFTLLGGRAGAGDAGAGLGLLAVALLGSAAALWAGADGWHGVPLPSLLIRWGLVTGIVAVYVPVLSFLLGRGPTLGALASDLIVVAPLVGMLMFGPAAIAAAASSVGAARRRSLGAASTRRP